MPKIKSQNRRTIIGLVVIVTVALIGLTMIKVDPAGAVNAKALGQTALQADEAAPPVAGGEQPGVASAVAKMISALALVILVAYGALYGLKKLMNRRYGGGGRNDSLEVLQSTFVGPHKQVSLVRVGQRSVLIGITEQQITTLTELDVEETEEFLGQVAPEAPAESFASRLTQATSKMKVFGLKKKQAALEV